MTGVNGRNQRNYELINGCMVDKLKSLLLELTTLYAERAFWLAGVGPLQGAERSEAFRARHSAGLEEERKDRQNAWTGPAGQKAS
jgi:hypothetical protein